ncbi:GspE/PulE family protein [Rubrivivax sp. A210]|uniref:GspE/PulE family protein n=1 Tax=Rubrivivax sp. A210 TaxID=2772301 RepID=UPI001F1F3BA0|nr:GspE/PulE family protein [Rubrivivax sp. A210]
MARVWVDEPPAISTASMAAITPVITPAQVAQARAEAARGGQPLVACLQALCEWHQPAFMQALGELMGYPVLEMAALLPLQARFDLVDFGECSQHGLLVCGQPSPLAAAADDGGVLLVLGDPFDGAIENWARQRLAGRGVLRFETALAHPLDLQASLARLERQLRAMDGIVQVEHDPGDADLAAVISLTSIGRDDSAVIKLVNSTLYDALKIGASDIHLECDAGCLHVQYRVDGVLMPVTTVAGQEMAEQIVSRIKVMAELDIAERRVPQDGRFKVRVNQRDIDFRVSVMPNIFGEDAVLRLLDRQALTERASALRLDNLGLDAEAMAQIRRLSNKPHGMLLVTGPTGSGKTTTLYATISEIHSGRDKIVTIEDPVEYRLQRVVQIPVNEKKGLTFARGLRSILRHDPDKIMVGEIRDSETAQIAVQAALTGHLVYTTVHANNVFDVLGRFLHMAVDAYSLAAALNGIVAQRLLRLNCPHCAVPVVPDAAALQDLGLDAAAVAGWTFKAGSGCGHCRGTGYKGRKAVAEVLTVNDTLRELMARPAPVAQLREHARLAGMVPVRESALACVARGETTLEEVQRVVG